MLAVLVLEDVYSETAYGAVRFGNGLGSGGSVSPIFQKQIEKKQPLTVTHPDATRYFMTIPEAVQLILQASLLEEFRGRVAMLEIGEPVRIVDLARNMLRLAGLPSENGGHVVFTGLRPGEKLHEELSAPTEESSPTAVPKVRMIRTGNESEFPVLTVADRWTRLSGAGRGSGATAELRGDEPLVEPSERDLTGAAMAAGEKS